MTSPPFTPGAGHAVLVVWAVGTGGAAGYSINFTAPGYTWHNSAWFQSGDTDITQGAAWAFNVPAGAVSFTTTNLGFSSWTYYVFDLGPVTVQDQYGAQLTPYPSNGMAQIPTNGPLVQAGEVAVVWQQCQFNVGTTPMAGYTSTGPYGSGVIYLTAAYNASAGPAGAVQTGGWSVFNSVGQAQILTFGTSGGGAGSQPGFPRSGRIEEPSEGMEESNVVPPDMGTPN